MGCGGSTEAGGITFSKVETCPVLKPKIIQGMSGDSPSGKPSDAIAYVAEGKTLSKQYDPATFPLTPELEAKGITKDQWSEICLSLRSGKGMTGFGGGFSAAIDSANTTFFEKVGVVGCYAEYGVGQKAMVVLTKEVAEGGRVKTVCPTLVPKHIMGVSGDSMAGKPDSALGYAAEGASMFGAQVCAVYTLQRDADLERTDHKKRAVTQSLLCSL